MIMRLLLTKLLPARLTWVIATLVLGRALAARRAATVTTTRRVTR